MNQDFIKKVAELLFQTYTAKEQETRLLVERELSALAQDAPNFFLALVGVIGSDHPSYDNQVKLSAATNLRQFVRQNVDNQTLDSSSRVSWGDQIFQLLISESISKEIKNLLGFALHPLLTIDSMGSSAEVLGHFTPLIAKALDGRVQQVLGALRAIKSIFSGICQHDFINTYAESLLTGNFVTIAEKAVLQIQLGLQNVQEAVVIEATSLLHEWGSTVTGILEFFELTTNKMIMKLTANPQMAAICAQIARIVLPDALLPSPQCMINLSNNQAHKELNQAKSQIYQSFNIVLQYLVDSKKKLAEQNGKVGKVVCLVGMDIPDSPFTEVSGALAREMINSLLIMCSAPNLDTYLAEELNSEVVVEMLLMLHKLVSEPRFFNVFSETYRTFLVNVCFVLLRISPSELDNFNNSPQEFVTFATDVCERQESEVIKTAAAQLLEQICEHIDGALTFTVYFWIQTLDCTITNQNVQETQAHEYLIEWAQSSIFLQSPPEVRMETSFTALSILSYLIPKRKDIGDLLERALVLYADALLSSTDGVLMSRICLFMYFYTEHLFENNNEIFNKYLSFLLQCTNSSACPRAVSVQACETLSYVVQEETILMKLENYIPHILTSMAQAIPHQKEKSFFDALQEVIQSYTEMITPELLTALLGAIVQKVATENEAYKQATDKKKDKIRILKCWNIVRTLVDSPEIIPKYRNELEQMLIPLFEFMKNPMECDFEDDIILAISSIIKKSKSISEVEITLVQTFPQVAVKYEDGLGHMFLCLSYFMQYGKEVLLTKPEIVNLICEMALKTLFARPKQRHNEAVMGEGALLLQQALLTFPGILDGSLETILKTCVSRLATEIKRQFFYARLLGVFLAAFNYNVQQSAAILSALPTMSGETALTVVINQINANIPQFIQPHDKKLAVVGICTLITMEPMSQEIANNLQMLFKALIKILNVKAEVNPASFSQGADPQRQTIMNFLMDELSENDLEGFNQTQLESLSHEIMGNMPNEDKKEENESNQAVKQFITPLAFFDEFDHFRTVINGISQRSQAALAQLVGFLDPDEQKLLVEFLQTRRVPIGPQANVREDRRIVKPLRFNQQTQ